MSYIKRLLDAFEGVICEEVEPGVFQPKIFPCGSPHTYEDDEYCSACLKECGSL